ncbi:MAG: sortase [Actinomycetota bacterium]|nr:sortase [Actinomycetota bacterium]
MRRFARIAGTLMIVSGIGALAWTLTVWQWQDPLTYATNRLEQRTLGQAFDRRLDEGGAALASAGPASVSKSAARWRKSSSRGDAVARIRIPAIGLDAVVANGTDTNTLKRGPGRYLGSAMPGEKELVYIAGHRTTHGAPFSRIDRLKQGDTVSLELPYGTFEYAITGHRIVAATETSVLKSKGYEQLALQACHPRFFATQRIIAYAKLVRMTPRERDATAEALG